MTLKSAHFKKSIQVRFRDCDPAGILFFAQIFSLAHDCFEDFINQSGIGWKTWFEERKYLVPIRQTEAQYFRPLVAGQEYEVTADVKKIGETSFQMFYSFSDSKNTHAEVTMVHAFMDPTTLKKMAIPEEIKLKLQKMSSLSDQGEINE